MELLQLRYFQTVARLEHMTKAAEELRIAQPALSKTIARLEEDLGVPLFDRQNRQIRLNAFGKAFLQKVDLALTALEEGRQEVSDMAGITRGRIHLATSTLERLSGPLAAFRAQYPEVRFRIIQIAPPATREMERLLETGEVDLCFSAASLEREGIVEWPVLKAEVVLAVPPGHPLEGRESIRLEEVAEEPFIEYREGHPFRKANEWISRKAGIIPPIVCEVEEPSALTNLVLAGLGMAYVPMCRPDEKMPFHVLRIDDMVCERVFTVACRENRYLSLAAQQFRKFLMHYYA